MWMRVVFELDIRQYSCTPPQNEPSLIKFLPKHLLMEDTTQLGSDTVNRFLQSRKSIIVWQTSALNQKPLKKDQWLDCEPLLGWERTGHSSSLKRNSCKLQIGKPLWDRALPFVVSFLLSSKSWHADVSSHSSRVITKMGEEHKRIIPDMALYSRRSTPGSWHVFK